MEQKFTNHKIIKLETDMSHKKKNYWFGKEIEGRLYGLETVFIPKDFKAKKGLFKKFNHFLVGPILIEQMTNEKSHIQWQQLENLIDAGKMVTLEVKPGQMKLIPQSMKLKAHILYWIDAAEIAEMKETDSIKLCSQSHDMFVFTLFNGQRVKRHDYIHDRYENYAK